MAESVHTHLMFQNKLALEAIRSYEKIFDGAFSIDELDLYDESAAGLTGQVQLAMCRLLGARITVVDSPVPHEFDMTPAVSLYVEMRRQRRARTALRRPRRRRRGVHARRRLRLQPAIQLDRRPLRVALAAQPAMTVEGRTSIRSNLEPVAPINVVRQWSEDELLVPQRHDVGLGVGGPGASAYAAFAAGISMLLLHRARRRGRHRYGPRAAPRPESALISADDGGLGSTHGSTTGGRLRRGRSEQKENADRSRLLRPRVA